MKILIIGGDTCDPADPGHAREHSRLLDACHLVGTQIGSDSHELIACSPFDDAAEVAVLKASAASRGDRELSVKFFFVDADGVSERLDTLVRSLGLAAPVRVPQPPSPGGSDSLRYSWLLCQLLALDSSDAVIAIGGKTGGTANMLMLLAEAKRKPLLPIPCLGGAARAAYERRRYELEDRLQAGCFVLTDERALGGVLPLLEALVGASAVVPAAQRALPREYFISYPRARQAEADFVEALLRRRNLAVFRDESEFGAGHSVPAQITEAIHRCDVFIVVWCAEYAASPWCFDEFELALDRHDAGRVQLWILCVDKTRIVPKRARTLLNFLAETRQELEGVVLRLLEGGTRFAALR
jgi:hypothetical protein